MKPIFNILFCLTCAFQLAAQRDSVTVEISTDTATFEKQRFIDRYDYLTGTKEPLKRVLKWDVLGILPTDLKNAQNFAIGLSLTGEIKLTNAISIQGTANVGTFRTSPLFVDIHRQWFLNVGIESRYYLNMPRRIRQGKSANNMTGPYVGLGISETFGLNYDAGGTDPAATARVGFQTRLFRRGYLDWSYGLGYQSSDIFGNGGVYGSSRIGLGLMFGTPKRKESASYCEVLNCFREERSLFKIDLLNIARFGPNHTFLNPNITWEHKLGNSAFSINMGTSLTKWRGKYRSSTPFGDSIIIREGNYTGLSVGAHVEPRWYFLQKHRIAKGKDGNNLSGPYIATAVEYSTNLKSSQDGVNGGNVYQYVVAITPSIGYQQRLFKNFYAGYEWHLGKFSYHSTLKTWDQNTTWSDFLLQHAFKMGIAF